MLLTNWICNRGRVVDFLIDIYDTAVLVSILRGAGLSSTQQKLDCRIHEGNPLRSKEPPISPRTPGRPRSERARKDILQSAYKLLKSKGFSSIRAQEIANRAGVSTATLYRWWNSKEEIMFDACFEHVRPALTFDGNGSPLTRLRNRFMRRTVWLHSEDARVMARLITGIHGNPDLHRMYLDWLYLPRRQMEVQLVEQAIACGELKRDTDPELMIDALYGPLFFRWLCLRWSPSEGKSVCLVFVVLLWNLFLSQQAHFGLGEGRSD